MDAMVTARMSVSKKEIGAAALKRLGLNASQAINLLYDHIIADGRLPWSPDTTVADDRTEVLERAVRQVDAIPRVPVQPGFEHMTTHQARLIRLGLDGQE